MMIFETNKTNRIRTHIHTYTQKDTPPKMTIKKWKCVYVSECVIESHIHTQTHKDHHECIRRGIELHSLATSAHCLWACVWRRLVLGGLSTSRRPMCCLHAGMCVCVCVCALCVCKDWKQERKRRQGGRKGKKK